MATEVPCSLWTDASPALERLGVFEAFDGIDQHAGFAARRAEVLRAADRVVVGISGEAHLAGLGVRLDRVLRDVQDGAFERAHDDLLVLVLEPWFKAIFACALPEKYEAHRDHPQAEKFHNLFGVLEALKLVSKGELEGTTAPGNHIRKVLCDVKERRNPKSHGAPRTYLPESRVRDALVAMVSAVDTYRRDISVGLFGLAVRDVADDVVFRQVGAERTAHLRKFRGRAALIASVVARVDEIRPTGGYLLLEARQGHGKSALVCALSRGAFGGERMKGASARAVREACPWLPGVLLHLGKQHKDPLGIVRSLVEQANALLLKPVALPSLRQQESEYEWRGVLVDRRGDIDDESSDDESRRIDIEATQRPRSAGHELQQALFGALDALVRERGSATFVVDALDELLATSVDIDFLPPSLPPGCVGVLTSQPVTRVSALRQRIRCQTYEVPGLDAEDVAVINDLSVDPEMNARLVAVTEGSPLLLQMKLDAARGRGGAITPGELEMGERELFARHKDLWRNPASEESKDVRFASLRFLAVMSRTGAVPLEAIQGYLESVGLVVSLNGIRESLASLTNQITGLEVGQVTLTHQRFAEYVLLDVLSHRDLERLLSDVATWLATESDVDEPAPVIDPGLRLAFLEAWSEVVGAVTPRQARSGGKLLALLVERGDVGAVERMLQRLPGKKVRTCSALRMRLLRAGTGLGSPAAMSELGLRLLRDGGCPRDPAGGLALLRTAASAGDTEATWELGALLLDGRGVPRDPDEGLALLRKAVNTGDAAAMRNLGSRLIDGRGVPKNPDEGLALVRRAVDAGDRGAFRILGWRLLDGWGVPQNKNEGLALLRKAVDAGDAPAMGILGMRLLDGHGVVRNADLGLALLRRAVDAGDRGAMGVLGGRLIVGDGVAREADEGLALLRRAVDAGDTRAMRVLGLHLIACRGVPTSTDDGLALLRGAVDAGDERAMLILGMRLLDGDGVPRSTGEGLALLRKAVDAGNADTMRVLGLRLLDGVGVPRSTDEGLALLRKSVEAGNTYAMRDLGMRLIGGNGVPSDRDEGLALLQRCVELGDEWAASHLGAALLDGHGVPRDMAAGLKVLRDGADRGDWLCIRELSERLLDGRGVPADAGAGEALLRGAVARGSARGAARLLLAKRLLDGQGVPGSTEEGMALLNQAIAAGNPFARLEYAERLLSGRGVPQDLKQASAHVRAIAEGDRRAPQVPRSSPIELPTLVKRLADAGETWAVTWLAERLPALPAVGGPE